MGFLLWRLLYEVSECERARDSQEIQKRTRSHLHDKIMLSCYFRLKFLLSHRNIHFDMDRFPHIDGESERASVLCVRRYCRVATVQQWQRMYACCVWATVAKNFLSLSIRSAICVRVYDRTNVGLLWLRFVVAVCVNHFMQSSIWSD